MPFATASSSTNKTSGGVIAVNLRTIGVLVLLGFASSWAPGTMADEWSEGFVLGSRVNVRTAPQARSPIVAALTVATPVRYRAARDGSCEIALFGDSSGFAPCALITSEKPTLASIDAALAALNPGSEEENDWLARRFYLSPSLNTLRLVRVRKGLSVGGLPIGETPPPVGVALFDALLDAFRGDVSGADFRPVDLRPNDTVVADLQALAPKGRKILEAPTAALPAPTPSLFRMPLDVLVAGWVHGTGSDENGAERAAAYLADWRSADIFEFSKLYPGQRFFVRHLDPGASPYDGEPVAWRRVGGVAVTFAVPPNAVVISRNRAISTVITDAETNVPQTNCGGTGLKVSANLEQPMFSQAGLLVALSPAMKVTQVTRLPDSVNPALYDFDGDMAADLADATYTVEGDLSPSLEYTFVLANIAGSWRLAQTIAEEDCD